MIVWTISDILTVGLLVLGAITMLVCIAFAYLHDYFTKLFCKHTVRDSVVAHFEHCRKCGKRFPKSQGGQNG